MATNFSDSYPGLSGGFLNYDVTANHTQGKPMTNGLLELGGFGSWGTAQTRILALDLRASERHPAGYHLDARPANANGQPCVWRRDQRHE